MTRTKTTLLAAFATAWALFGCQATLLGPVEPAPISQADGRLNLDLATLSDQAPMRTRLAAPSDPVIEERIDWQRSDQDDPFAGLVLREFRSVAGTPSTLAVPADPRESVGQWNILARRALYFDDRFTTSNTFGPATWRRFTMGGSICVVFSQSRAAEAGAVLEGFYCAPAGGQLSIGQAETVVQSVQVREAGPEPSG